MTLILAGIVPARNPTAVQWRGDGDDPARSRTAEPSDVTSLRISRSGLWPTRPSRGTLPDRSLRAAVVREMSGPLSPTGASSCATEELQVRATQVVLLGGLRLDEQQRTLSAADRIVALALLEEHGALPLGGCVLFVELVDSEAAPKEQAVRIALQGPPGTLGLMNRPVAFAAAEDGQRKATVLLNLDGVGVKTPGSYAFRVFSGADEVGTLELAATVARGTARIRLGTVGEGRLPFTLLAADGAFGGYVEVGIERPADGADELLLPPGYARLARSPAFAAAVRCAFDDATRGVGEAAASDVVIELPD
jgi:hypothetical protein